MARKATIDLRWSPLEEALYFLNERAVSLLLERGATVTSLRTAAALGRLDLMALCFDETGALTAVAGEITWPFSKPIPEAVRRDRKQILSNALVYAAAWGQMEAAARLVDRGAEVNLIPAGFDFSGTALHYAGLEGRREMVDWLFALVSLGWPILARTLFQHDRLLGAGLATVSPFYVIFDLTNGTESRHNLGPLVVRFPGWIVVQAVVALVLLLATLATFDRCIGRIRG
jgi:Ankyrin repeats (many copies)